CNSKVLRRSYNKSSVGFEKFLSRLILATTKDIPETVERVEKVACTIFYSCYSRHSWLKNVYVGQQGEYLEFVHDLHTPKIMVSKNNGKE
ncbi:15191_t:CDS:2, partial [Funneliformis mosseae]